MRVAWFSAPCDAFRLTVPWSVAHAFQLTIPWIASFPFLASASGAANARRARLVALAARDRGSIPAGVVAGLGMAEWGWRLGRATAVIPAGCGVVAAEGLWLRAGPRRRAKAGGSGGRTETVVGRRGGYESRS